MTSTTPGDQYHQQQQQKGYEKTNNNNNNNNNIDTIDSHNANKVTSRVSGVMNRKKFLWSHKLIQRNNNNNNHNNRRSRSKKTKKNSFITSTVRKQVDLLIRFLSLYSVFHRLRQAKFNNCASIFSSNQFLILLQ